MFLLQCDQCGELSLPKENLSKIKGFFVIQYDGYHECKSEYQHLCQLCGRAFGLKTMDQSIERRQVRKRHNPDELLKELDKLECRTHSDSHPELHKLIVDYLFEHYEVAKKVGSPAEQMTNA